MNRVRSFYALGVILGVIAVLVVATNRDATKPPTSRGALPGDLVIGEPVVHENLTIFPVSSRTSRTQDRFITLDEGLASGKVEIVEKGALRQSQPTSQSAGQPSEDNPPATSGSQDQNSEAQLSAVEMPGAQGNEVDELMVVNHSGRPLYLMPGEIIVGGDQDRTIGREYVVAPDGRPVPLDVYCVEHGRWGSRAEAEYQELSLAINQTQSRAFAVGDLVVPVADAQQVAAQANSGKFVGSVGSLSKNVRLAVQSGDGQGKVWEEVSTENAKAGVQPQSGAFTANYADDEAVKRFQPYIDKLHGPVAQTEHVVGVIVAVNGKIESMDVFESTPLFKKLWPKLLKSHALDAANATGAEVAGKACTRQDAVAFLTETAAAGASKTETKGDIAVSRRENERVLLFSAHSWDEVRDPAAARADASAGGFGGGGLGGVHAAAFAK
jgi:hypothetical protein